MKRLRSTAERPSGGRAPRLGVFLLSAAILTSACDSSSDKSSGNFFGRGDALSETLAGVRALRSEERFLDAVNTLKSAEGEFTGEDLRTVSRLKARCYLDANVALRAEAGVQELLARDANDIASQILLGEAQRQLHRFDSAEATLREALQKRPGDLEAELSLARTLYRLGKGEESVRLFEHFLEKAITEEGDYGPGRPIRELRLEYGRALAQAGRLEESADVFARLLEERPLESALYRELASTQFRLRRREAGIFLKKIYDAVSQRDYQKQIERRLLDSGHFEFGLGQRAFNHYKEKRFLESFKVYERALELDLQDSRLHSFYARLLVELACPKKALEILDDALRRKLTPASGVYVRQASAYLVLEDREAAERSLAATLKALDREGNLGGVEKGQADGAMAFMERLANLIEMGRAGEALALLDRVPSHGVPPFRVSFWRGRCLRELKRPEEALVAYQRAVSDGGEKFFEVAVGFAQVLLDLRRFDQAKRLLLGVMQKGGNTDLEVYEVLADLQKQGVQIGAGFEESHRQLRALHDRRKQIRKELLGLPMNRERGLRSIELARVLLLLRQPKMAADFLVLGAELAPDSPDGYRLLLGHLKRNEDVFMRLKYLHRALKLEPDDVDYNRALAKIYLSLQVRLDDAHAAATRLLRLQPGPESQKLLQDVEAAMGK